MNIYAQEVIQNKAIGTLGTKSAENYFSSLLSAAITFIMTISAIAFFFWFIIGALNWITSGGDKSKTEMARNRITQALIGLVLLFATWAVISLAESIFGINITSLAFSDFYIN